MNITETGDSFEEAVIVQDEPLAPSAAIAKLDNFANMPEMMAYASVLLASKLLPTSMKTPEAVVTVVLAGKELGMPAIASINNIVPIQGRPTLGIHAIGALLRRAGGASQTLEDFVPVMGPDGTDTAGKVVDYRTTIRFYRPYRDKVLEEDASFTWKEATKMGLTDKDNWKRMPKVMLYSRCFALGARRCAPDAMLGMYETGEWADVTNQKYKVDSEGEVTIL